MSAAQRTINAARASRKLIVLGLRWTTCQNILKDYFTKFGIVDNARVTFDLETGRSKGFGFVVMRNMKDASKAMAAAPHIIEGKTVHIDYRHSQAASRASNIPEHTTAQRSSKDKERNSYNENTSDESSDSESSDSDSDDNT